MVGITERIVIVDDVITKGSTALAAASRLAEIYPDADMKVFALVRTKGLVPDIDRILDPTTGIVRLVGDEGDRQP
jgi:orotate phosphoribosyltransferase-like protein